MVWYLLNVLGCLRGVSFQGGLQAPFNHLAWVPDARLLVLANAKWEAIYVAHLDAGCASFDSITEFRAIMPVISIAALWEASTEVVHLFCIQTEVRVHGLSIRHCGGSTRQIDSAAACYLCLSILQSKPV